MHVEQVPGLLASPDVQIMALKVLGPLAARITGSLAARWNAGKEARKELDTATVRAFVLSAEAAYSPGIHDASNWLDSVSQFLDDVLTDEVVEQLTKAVLTEGADSAAFFTAWQIAEAHARPVPSGFDMRELVQELPWHLADELLSSASKPGSRLYSAVELGLLRQIAGSLRPAQRISADELRIELLQLARSLDVEALTRRLPHYLPPGFDLSTMTRQVQVHRSVRSELQHGTSELQAYLPAEARARRDVAPIPLEDAVRTHPRLVILADPGMGKSWLIRSLTHQLASRAIETLQDEEGRLEDLVLPLPVRCDELSSLPDESLASALVTLIGRRHPGLLSPALSAWLEDYVGSGKGLLLLDALDENPYEQRATLSRLLDAWLVAAPNGRFVVTSRIAGYTAPPLTGEGITEAELQAFSDEDVAAALALWPLSDSRAARLRQQLRQRDLAGMARIPLLLALLCAVSADPGPLPATRAELYQRVLRRFLLHEHRPPAASPGHADRLLGVLAPVAAAFAEHPNGWVDLMSATSLRAAIRSAGSGFTELGLGADAVIEELSVAAGVLVPAGTQMSGRDQPYLFVHRTVQEYLTAIHVAGLPNSDLFATVQRHLWFDPDWRQPLMLLAPALAAEGRCEEYLRQLLDLAEDPFDIGLDVATAALFELPTEQARAVAALTWTAVLRLLHMETLRHPYRLGYSHRLSGLLRSPAGRTVTDRCLRLLRLTNDRRTQAAIIHGLTEDPSDEVTDALLTTLRASDDPYIVRLLARALAGRADQRVTEALLRALDVTTSDTAAAALVKAIAGRPEDAVTAALLRASAATPDRQEAAAEALGAQAGQAVTDALFRLLISPETLVRRAARRALSGRDDAHTTESLVKLFTTSSDSTLRNWAAEILGSVPGLAAEEALFDALVGEDSSRRRAASQALANRPGEQVTRKLLQIITLSDNDATLAALRALQDRPGTNVTSAFLDCFSRIEVSSTPTAWELETTIARGLAGRPGGSVTAALLRLATQPKPAYAAIRGLVGRSESAVTAALCSLAARDDSAELVRPLSQALEGRAGDNVARALVRLLQICTEPMPLSNIVRELGNHPGEPVTEALISLAHRTTHERVRVAFAGSLSGRPGAQVTRVLLDFLTSDDDDTLLATTKALADRPGEDVTRELFILLKHWLPAQGERMYLRPLSEALSHRNEEWLTDELLMLLRNSEHESTRRAAAGALREGPSETVVPRLLETVATSRDADTRAAAADALESGAPELAEHRLRMILDWAGDNPSRVLEVYAVANRLTAQCYGMLTVDRQAALRSELHLFKQRLPVRTD